MFFLFLRIKHPILQIPVFSQFSALHMQSYPIPVFFKSCESKRPILFSTFDIFVPYTFFFYGTSSREQGAPAIS